MAVWCELKILSLKITVRHHSARLVMQNSYPCDRIFNPHLTTIKDSYSLHMLTFMHISVFTCILKIFFMGRLLAHLSRRLTRWAYSIPMVRRRPSVRRRPHFQTWISLKPVGQSWSNFMCSITGMGERLHKVWGQIGWKLWFLWQQKAPIDL